jgi:hypothetical protein
MRFFFPLATISYVGDRFRQWSRDVVWEMQLNDTPNNITDWNLDCNVFAEFIAISDLASDGLVNRTSYRIRRSVEHATGRGPIG